MTSEEVRALRDGDHVRYGNGGSALDLTHGRAYEIEVKEGGAPIFYDDVGDERAAYAHASDLSLVTEERANTVKVGDSLVFRDGAEGLPSDVTPGKHYLIHAYNYGELFFYDDDGEKRRRFNGDTSVDVQEGCATLHPRIVPGFPEEPEVTLDPEGFIQPCDPVFRPYHYARYVIEPITFINANKLPYNIGNVIKYACRYDEKNGVEDLEKARRYLDIQIECMKRDGRVAGGEDATTVWKDHGCSTL